MSGISDKPIVRSVRWALPDWIFEELDLVSARPARHQRMALAIELAHRNVEHGGGPFGAVVFERQSGAVVAPGVNLVVSQQCSLLHAEIVALTFAQARPGSFTLASGDYELVTSSEPCVQCLGALYWAGLASVVCGARLEQAVSAGFDEGPRAADWKEQLEARGIAVATDVLSDSAGAVLVSYSARGGIVYNAWPK